MKGDEISPNTLEQNLLKCIKTLLLRRIYCFADQLNNINGKLFA